MTQDYRNQEATIKDFQSLLATNPAYENLYLALFEICQNEVDRSEAARLLDQVDRPKTIMQTGQQIITMLVQRNIIIQHIYVNGELYDGDEVQLRDDEAIPDNASIEYRLVTSAAGKEVLAQSNPTRKITELFQAKPQHERAFLKVLDACMEEQKSQPEIEDLFAEDDEALKVNADEGIPTILPAYFTGALEKAGALVWKDAWHVSKEGRAFREAWA